MIALEGRLHWRKVAPFHVQVELLKSSMEFQVPSAVEISSRVVRIFRTDERLKPGDQVSFVLWVCRPGDEPTGPAYVYYDNFLQATHMEVYLHESPPKCELAGYEFILLHGPSDEAIMSVAQLEEELRSLQQVLETKSLTASKPPWWQFWTHEQQNRRFSTKTNLRAPRGSDWLTKLHEPFFRNQKEAEMYVTSELAQTVPEGWTMVQAPGERLTWIIKKERLEPKEWGLQDYSVRLSKGLDLVVLTYGNNDVGPFDLRHALHNALVIETGMFREFNLRECMLLLFSACKPNEWGYT